MIARCSRLKRQPGGRFWFTKYCLCKPRVSKPSERNCQYTHTRDRREYEWMAWCTMPAGLRVEASK